MKETIKDVVKVYLPDLLQNEEESKKMEKL